MRFGFILVLFSSQLFAQALPTVDLPAGRLQGIATQSGGEKYLGIPYARPPIGMGRWAAPRELPPWTGVRSAKNFSAICSQISGIYSNTAPETFDQPVGSENCLYLNIWRPRRTSTQLKPIVMWIHGGSNFKGAGSDPIYEGERLSAEADVVVVTANYRLGFFGALNLAELKNGDKLDDSGNYTTLDLIQILKWLQKNAAGVGGDPNNITIMGQSSGCMNVWGLVQSPLANNLFQRSACFSGIPNSYPKEIAELRAQQLVTGLGFFKSRTELRNFLYEQSAEAILQASRSLIPIQHIADGYVLPAGGLFDFAANHFTALPMILGTTSDEVNFLMLPFFTGLNQKRIYGLINSQDRKLSRSDFISPLLQIQFLTTAAAANSIFNFTVDRLTGLYSKRQNQTYRSIFKWKNLPAPWRDLFGAFHGLDIAMLFGNFITDRPNITRFAWTAENLRDREKLHAEMVRQFKGYFRNGNLELSDDGDWVIRR